MVYLRKKDRVFERISLTFFPQNFSVSRVVHGPFVWSANGYDRSKLRISTEQLN